MQTRHLILLLVPLVLIAGFLTQLTRSGATSSGSTSVIDPQVAYVVSQFGKQLQYVPLLAPALDTQSAIDEHYAAYVTPELLSVWRAKPRSAPGRRTSSPWPDRIEVRSVELQKDGSYIIHGDVVEVSSSELTQGSAANSYPVTLRLARHNKNWLIMQFVDDLR